MSKDTWEEPADLLEMANILGMDVNVERINFSFYFSFKTGMQHGIRVKIKWNRDRFRGVEDGYMDLHGQYDYVQSEYGASASETEISKARDFFVKYKVLFAAVWEEVLDPWYLQEYFSEHVNFAELLLALDEPMADLVKEAESLKDLEKIVRAKHLFDMND